MKVHSLSVRSFQVPPRRDLRLSAKLSISAYFAATRVNSPANALNGPIGLMVFFSSRISPLTSLHPPMHPSPPFAFTYP